MKITFRKYAPNQDFIRVRDFLSQTFAAFKMPLNWRIERWNYGRYFVAPMLGSYYGKASEAEAGMKAIRFWEEIIRLWENEDGNIVGVVNIEHPDVNHPGFGEAFIQRHPDYTFLLDEMLDYAEKNLLNIESNSLFLSVSDRDTPMQEILQKRDYVVDMEHPGYDSVYTINDLPKPRLPAGFRLQSMADDNNIEFRRKVFGLAFNHPDPVDWPSAFSYEELQKAPDYQKDLDLVTVDPAGDYVSCCIAWYDDRNRLGILEPVGTHPDFRRRGLGREVVLEGIRRLAALGAAEAQVGSGQRFYEAIDFQKKYTSYRWTKQF